MDAPDRSDAARVPVQDRGVAAARDAPLELELVVDRLARLVLQAQALADRVEHRLPAPSAERLDRLRAGVELGRTALLASVRVALPAARVPEERRRAERRQGSSAG